jgi:hypothetical protein
MTHDQMPEFVKLLTALSLSYGETLNEFRIERYWLTLERFDYEIVKKALETLTTHNPDRGYKMPEGSDILRYLEGGTHVKALQAWGGVLKVIRCIGSYQSVVFDDSILHRVIDDMGGWIHLCETTVRELSFLGQTFQKLYAAYALNPPTEYPRSLAGRYDNSPTSTPLLIGNSQKATQVYEQGVDATFLFRKTPMLSKQPDLTALPNAESKLLLATEEDEE